MKSPKWEGPLPPHPPAEFPRAGWVRNSEILLGSEKIRHWRPGLSKGELSHFPIKQVEFLAQSPSAFPKEEGRKACLSCLLHTRGHQHGGGVGPRGFS